MLTPWIVGLVFGTLILLWFLLENRRMVRNKRKRFSRRERLDVKALQRLFPDSDLTLDEFTEFLTYVERATEVPKEYLRPGDRFDRELAAERGWEFDDGLNLLPRVLHRRFGGAFEGYALAASPTLADLLEVVRRASQSGGAAGTGPARTRPHRQ